MTKVVELPDRRQLRIEAAAWIAKIDAGNLTAEDLGALRAWANVSPYHREALDLVASNWDDLNVLAVYRQAMDIPARRRLPSVASGAIAAGIALLGAALWIYSPAENEQVSRLLVSNGLYTTKLGEQRVVALPDGSSVRLNTDSQVQVSYSATQRGLQLSKGEAFFDVTKNKQLPFVVSALGRDVVAVGTAFAVKLQPESLIQVIVSEGQVRIDHREMPVNNLSRDELMLAEPELVVAGQVAVYSNEQMESIENLVIQEVDRRLAWRSGMLMFEGETLSKAVAEIGRYTPLEVVISDPSLKELEIGGYFRIGDTEVLLQTLASDFGIEVERLGPDLVHLRKNVD